MSTKTFPEGGAPRSEFKISMIAGGNHTIMNRWPGVSRVG